MKRFLWLSKLDWIVFGIGVVMHFTTNLISWYMQVSINFLLEPPQSIEECVGMALQVILVGLPSFMIYNGFILKHWSE